MYSDSLVHYQELLLSFFYQNQMGFFPFWETLTMNDDNLLKAYYLEGTLKYEDYTNASFW